VKRLACKPGMGGAFIPGFCDLRARGPLPGGEAADCGRGTFSVVPEGSAFVDQQSLKLQVRLARVRTPRPSRAPRSRYQAAAVFEGDSQGAAHACSGLLVGKRSCRSGGPSRRR
jgi:hypothetical protein